MKKKENKHPWIKLKKYPHIGFPLENKEIPKLEGYITNPKKIAKHSFLPFIHRSIFQRKFRANNEGNLNPSKKRVRERSTKVREIYFASHFDAQIYSYYSYILSKKYEDILKTKNFNSSVVAYRKIETLNKPGKNKCNIDFALEAFEFIKTNKNQELTVIVADITKFFDNLNHEILKKKWAEVWNNTDKLPDDHYRVYKSLVNLRYVNEGALFKHFQNKIWVTRGVENKPKVTTKKQIHIKHKKYLKDNNAIAFCSRDDFFKEAIRLVCSKPKNKGIPQGTALSATLANIYMLDFDQEIKDFVNEKLINGFYQRYSDDLILIVPRKYQTQAITKVRSLITEKVYLDIQPQKTKIYHFDRNSGYYYGFEIDEDTGERGNRSLEYLGFSFDGQKVLIKSAGYSKFYRSMKSSFKRATSLAKYAKSSDDKIHKSSLYKRYTHKGAHRKMFFCKITKKTHSDWGNYLSYVKKANNTFYSFNQGNYIKRQSRKTWYNFHKLMNKSIKEIERFKKEERT